ncbi:MAG: hypothetical protein HC821_04450 [Lewinella sp.]|nr:hypothetical protein [Lewinella sp.]
MISGTAGAVGLAPAQARVRLSRSLENEWTLEADYTGGTNFVSQGSAGDPVLGEVAQLEVFAFNCLYTATRTTAFYLDDVTLGPIVSDLAAPQLNALTLAAPNRIRLAFNEPLEASVMGLMSNYSVLPNNPTLPASPWLATTSICSSTAT